MRLRFVARRLPGRLATAAAVTLCAALGAQAAAHLVEARYLADASKAAPARLARADLAPRAPAAARHSKRGEGLAARNIFCADCAPLSDAPLGSAHLSSLMLVATNISDDAARSFASIADLASGTQGSYRVGDPVRGVGTVSAVRFRSVEVTLADGRVERLSLDAAPSEPSPPTTPVAPAPAVDRPASPGDEISRQIAEGTRKIDETHYEISRALVDSVLANPVAFVRKIRGVPALKDGQPDGLKVFGVTAATLPAKLGLANGDLLQAINGFPLTSPENGLEAYGKLRDASSLELQIQRRGKPLTLSVSIR